VQICTENDQPLELMQCHSLVLESIVGWFIDDNWPKVFTKLGLGRGTQ
jgi:hypothetical protein